MLALNKLYRRVNLILRRYISMVAARVMRRGPKARVESVWSAGRRPARKEEKILNFLNQEVGWSSTFEI